VAKFKVLLVDDEEEFVNAISERLKMRDLGPEVALDGEAALEVVKDEVPDVMVLDLRMPGIDGLEVLRRVKQNYPKVQVVVLTGHGSDKDEEEARRLGAFEYLQKPVEIDTLVHTLKRAYQQKMEDTMVAATFAEAGDYESAKQVMSEQKKKKEKK
jgi:DNA-binding NtrC family response regulator